MRYIQDLQKWMHPYRDRSSLGKFQGRSRDLDLQVVGRVHSGESAAVRSSSGMPWVSIPVKVDFEDCRRWWMAEPTKPPNNTTDVRVPTFSTSKMVIGELGSRFFA